ncbi:hypothetical protein FIBSPDRAFT_900331 [Athelia psychrophila]|uniref:Uncharacterized protein n=1 Tax=Athelia psychrophila TaxID=1759441 RepID=A0A165YKH3_9AGAM|nr:hypothetical protein FIBSPDRAFT_900331 [Fibularhizoctonia sp. CBS 109695]
MHDQPCDVVTFEGTYSQKFITIGGWLLKKNKISDSEFATQYWNGIPRSFRNKIENRLLAKDPARSLTEPFKRDQFDAYLNKSNDDSDSDNSSSEDEDSSSDSEDNLRRLRNMKYQTKKTRFSVSESDSDSSDDVLQVKSQASKSLKKKVNSKNILTVVHQSAFATDTSAPPVQYPQHSNTAFQPQQPLHMSSNYPPPRQFHDIQSPPPRPFNNMPPPSRSVIQ